MAGVLDLDGVNCFVPFAIEENSITSEGCDLFKQHKENSMVNHAAFCE